MTVNNRLLGGILALVALLGTLSLGLYYAHQAGIQKGVDSYHNFCYTYGGYIVDESTGTVVQCAPMTQLPEAERKIFLDKGKELVYND